MRPVARLAAQAELAVRSLPSVSSRRTFVCPSCRARARNQPASTTSSAQQKRALSLSTTRKAESAVTGEAEEKYTAARDWEGLEWVGSKDWLYARDSRPVAHERYGEPTVPSVFPKDAILRSLHRAIIESLALDELNISAEKRLAILEETKSKHISSRGIGIALSKESGKPGLVFSSQEVKARLYQQLGIDSEELSRLGPGLTFRKESLGWTNLPLLKGVQQRFTIIKRVAQLTGSALPDVAISGSSTVHEVLNKLKRQPKPQTVLQSLASDQRLTDLNNITIHGRRQSYIDEDRAKGRWKVIEQELLDRGLPLPRGKSKLRKLRQKQAHEHREKRIERKQSRKLVEPASTATQMS